MTIHTDITCHHRSVKKDSKTTPIRIVYDCSCLQSIDAPSLNDCLQTGPALHNDLSAILLRFRLNDIALTSDIEKAFLNIRLKKDDREFTKFLWLSNSSDVESALKVYRFKVVLFGAVCSPFILNTVVKTHLESNASIPPTSNLEGNIYVDNVVSGTTTQAEALDYFNEANSLMKSGGFNLRSWSSNSEKLRAVSANDETLNPDNNVNVLGIRWLVNTDQITYNKKDSARIQDKSVITKRKVVQDTASLYDPLGYLTPVVVGAKLFIQKLWKNNIDWDDPLSDDMHRHWKDV
ncbi:uncharacterized protein LOC100378611 [Saccoglossus kowalevskii]|uniref:Uncharacterized protein LOC100378611 n=1 Tax=Saccoglossus kowalevskii TaxID=10224 RepID=A0ABM0M5H0_SACKO|nr:PREDICTED: uncharacterized protein LOC100378611 [Saccoglossus kowalevskii]